MIGIDDLQRLYDHARSVRWFNRDILRFHVYAPAFNAESVNFLSVFTRKAPLPDGGDQILGVRTIFYPEGASGELFHYVAVLENVETGDAITLSETDGRPTTAFLRKWLLLETDR